MEWGALLSYPKSRLWNLSVNLPISCKSPAAWARWANVENGDAARASVCASSPTSSRCFERGCQLDEGSVGERPAESEWAQYIGKLGNCSIHILSQHQRFIQYNMTSPGRFVADFGTTRRWLACSYADRISCG